MKNIYLIVLFMSLFSECYGLKIPANNSTAESTELWLVWLAQKNSKTVEIPACQNKNKNYYVKWGDGTQEASRPNKKTTHIYKDTKNYNILISGDYKSLCFGSDTIPSLSKSASQFIALKSWGSIKYENFHNAFSNMKKIVFDTNDKANTSSVIDMSSMFKNTSFHQNIDDWDTSNVINMSQMFEGAEAFASDLSHWDTSKVKYMQNMFNNAKSFNGHIYMWDTSLVENMNYMFLNAKSFIGDVSKWNTQSVTTHEDFSLRSGDLDIPFWIK